MHVALKKHINSFLGEPLTSEEWFTLEKKWQVEMSVQSAALFLGLSENRVMQLAGSRLNVLKRTRRGHVSTKSVMKYRDKLCVKK